MKCGLNVIWRANKKGTKRQPVKWVSWYHLEEVERNWGDHPDKPDMLELKEGDVLEVCDGNVGVTVKAVDEPDWGGTYASFEIEYKCDKCGGSYYPELPQYDEDMSLFITEAVARMPEEEAALLREIVRQRAIADHERRVKDYEEEQRRKAERSGGKRKLPG